MATKRPARSSSYSPDSEKAIRFCAEWLKDCNGAAAARRAGYAEKTARGAACELMAMPAIQTRLGVLIAAQRERVQFDADTVLRELLRVALVDIGGAYDASGCLKPIHEIPEDVRRAISGIEVEELTEWDDSPEENGAPRSRANRKKVVIGHTTKVKFWSKVDALTRLGQNLKLWIERHEHSADESLSSLLAGTFKDPPKP